MIKSIPIVLLLTATSMTAAHVARADDSTEVLDDVRVIMPPGSSSVVEAPARPVTRQVADQDRPLVEFNFSTWSPSSLTLDSHIQNASSFQEAGLPAVSGGYTSAPLLRSQAGSVSFRAGIGLARLNRTGTVEVPGSPELYNQVAYLVPIELGFELRPSILQWKSFGVLMDASLLPTLLMTERSPFDDGRTLVGLPARFLVGGSYDMRGLLPVTTPAFFELGVSQTVGSVSEGSMNGTGILAGVRVAI